MVTIFATDRRGAEHEIEGESGLSLMRNLKDVGGLDVPAICGGNRACGTCHVHVDAAWYGRLPAPTIDETELIEDEPAYQAGTSRLSCQIKVDETLDGIRVVLVPLG
ncbi:2Fe-2S iron-sulfur cluster-binding protein [Paraburkholderia sp.]|uniref:2Fe-2S iron-sulfur cluster-binding protein n=1 Tax=Paraburkholderia sp. TaxID=1926495 RepID=UPI0039E61432